MTIPKPINTATQKIKMAAAHFIVAWTKQDALQRAARRPNFGPH
jgi:hypothetical protein